MERRGDVYRKCKTRSRDRHKAFSVGNRSPLLARHSFQTRRCNVQGSRPGVTNGPQSESRHLRYCWLALLSALSMCAKRPEGSRTLHCRERTPVGGIGSHWEPEHSLTDSCGCFLGCRSEGDALRQSESDRRHTKCPAIFRF